MSLMSSTETGGYAVPANDDDDDTEMLKPFETYSASAAASAPIRQFGGNQGTVSDDDIAEDDEPLFFKGTSKPVNSRAMVKRQDLTKDNYEKFLNGQFEESDAIGGDDNIQRLPDGSKVQRLHQWLRNRVSGTYRVGKGQDRKRVKRRVKAAKTKEYRDKQAAETYQVLLKNPKDLSKEELLRAKNVTRLKAEKDQIIEALRREGVDGDDLTLSKAYHHKWNPQNMPKRIRNYFQARGRQTRFKKRRANLMSEMPQRLNGMSYQERSAFLKGILSKGWRGHPRGRYAKVDDNGIVIINDKTQKPSIIKVQNRQVPWTRHTPPQVTAKTPRTKTLMQIASIAAGAPVDSTQKCARLVVSAGKVPRETNENDAARKNDMKKQYEALRLEKYNDYITNVGDTHLPIELKDLNEKTINEYATMPVRQYKTNNIAWHTFHLQDKAAVRDNQREKTLRDSLKFSLKETQDIMNGTMRKFESNGELANPLARALRQAMKQVREKSSKGQLTQDQVDIIVSELTEQSLDVDGKPGSPMARVKGYGKKQINLKTGKPFKTNPQPGRGQAPGQADDMGEQMLDALTRLNEDDDGDGEEKEEESDEDGATAILVDDSEVHLNGTIGSKRKVEKPDNGDEQSDSYEDIPMINAQSQEPPGKKRRG